MPSPSTQGAGRPTGAPAHLACGALAAPTASTTSVACVASGERPRGLRYTNILVDDLSGVPRARAEVPRHPRGAISVIVWAEVLVGARNAEEESAIRDFLAGFDLLPLDRETVEEAVRLRREHRLRLPDALIWASQRRVARHPQHPGFPGPTNPASECPPRVPRAVRDLAGCGGRPVGALSNTRMAQGRWLY